MLFVHKLEVVFPLAALVAQAFAAPPAQIPLGEIYIPPAAASTHGRPDGLRRLHGRFLHFTDFHPDPFYKVYSDRNDACHRGNGSAGVYGAEKTSCDSPIALVNKTMEWVAKEFRDNIDFVIWTGDSARHDNDEDIPRNRDQVLSLNSLMVQKMAEAFGKHNGDEEDDDPNNDFVIPIVPTLGNNDILPHNIMRPGPNDWTRTYSKVWQQFIPEAQRHQFEQGGWFFVEVIPDKLAVFSLNTMFFFTRNAAADGCAQPSEPGYSQMEWLRIQLQFMRDRGMKVILIGHVPPTREESKTNWAESCWQKYTLWLQQYRDVVISSHYGHFNYDHLILQDFKDLRKGTKKGRMPDYDVNYLLDEDLQANAASSYFIELREAWSAIPDPPKSLGTSSASEGRAGATCGSSTSWCQLTEILPNVMKKGGKGKGKKELDKYHKKIGGKYAERYAAAFVTASVVPNMFPVVRVYEYNITGLEDAWQGDSIGFGSTPATMPTSSSNDSLHVLKKYKFDIPKPPSKSTPPGPAYSPQTLSLLRYRQYLANLTYINNDLNDSREMESDYVNSKAIEARGKESKKIDQPFERGRSPDPKEFAFVPHYNTHDDEVYMLPDLTMPNLIDLARRIGDFKPMEDIAGTHSAMSDDAPKKEKKTKKKHKKGKHKKGKHKKDKQDGKRRESERAWFTFIRRAFVETLTPEEVRDQFGWR